VPEKEVAVDGSRQRLLTSMEEFPLSGCREFIADGFRYKELTLAELAYFAKYEPQFISMINGVWVAPIGVENGN
jgi:hypothetical protein